MSQVTEYVVSGSPLTMAALAAELEAMFAAAASANRGATAPDNSFEGMFWWDTSGTPTETLKRYTVAAGWVSLLSVNSTTGAIASVGHFPAPSASKHGALIIQNDDDDGFDLLSGQGTSGQILTSNGPDAAPSFQTKESIANISEDTTPELGGELDCGAHSIGFTQQTATGDGATTIDWRLGNKFKFTFGAMSETFTFTAPSNPCNLLLMLVQDGTGSRTASWPATVKWVGGIAPTLTTTGGGIDLVSFYFDGTNYFGMAAMAFA